MPVFSAAGHARLSGIRRPHRDSTCNVARFTLDVQEMRRRLLILVTIFAVLVTLGSLLAGGIVIARASTTDGLVRTRATECATPRTYARHSPAEIEDCITRVVRRDMAA